MRDTRPLDLVGLRVVGVCLVLLVAAVSLVVTVSAEPLGRSALLPWPVLLVAALLAEAAVVHVHVGRQVHSTSLAEVPLVLGLFCVDPVTLVLTRVAAGMLVHLLVRRLPLVKVAFNSTLFLIDVGLLLHLSDLALAEDATPAAADPVLWLAVLAAVAIASCVQAVAVSVVIGLYEGAPGPQQLARDCVSALPVPLVLTTVALVAVAGLQADPGFVWFVVAGAVTLALGQRSYARHWYRHQGLERMAAFGSAVRGTGLDEETLHTVLLRARDLLAVERASLAVSAGEEGPVVVSVLADGALRRLDGEEGEPAVWLSAAVTAHRAPVVVGRTASDLQARQWLARTGAREAVAVPVLVGDEVAGVLWASDRLGGVRDLDEDDATLLEAVAGQVGLALQNSRLRRDADSRARHEAVLRRESQQDALTGLANRRALEARMAELLTSDLVATSVLFGDLDGFKPVNDAHGHRVGDEVLVEVARRLEAAAGPGDLVARIGGDEFVVLRSGSGPDELQRLAGRLEEAVGAPMATAAGPVRVGMSLGAATALAGQSPAEVLAAADRAMYLAKRARPVGTRA